MPSPAEPDDGQVGSDKGAEAGDLLADAKGKLFELEAELPLVKQNNELLQKRLDQAERAKRNGHPLGQLISTEEKHSLSELQRELAKVMVQPSAARG